MLPITWGFPGPSNISAITKSLKREVTAARGVNTNISANTSSTSICPSYGGFRHVTLSTEAANFNDSVCFVDTGSGNNTSSGASESRTPTSINTGTVLNWSIGVAPNHANWPLSPQPQQQHAISDTNSSSPSATWREDPSPNWHEIMAMTAAANLEQFHTNSVQQPHRAAMPTAAAAAAIKSVSVGNGVTVDASALRALAATTTAAALELTAATTKARARSGTGVDVSTSDNLSILSTKWRTAVQAMLMDIAPNVIESIQQLAAAAENEEDGAIGDVGMMEVMARLNINAKTVRFNAKKGEFDQP